MKMDSVVDFLNEVIEETGVSEAQKTFLLGLYQIGIAKLSLEALMTLKGRNPEFRQKVDAFFSDSFNSLGQKQKEDFRRMVDESKDNHFLEILVAFAKSLPAAQRRKIEANLEKLAGK